MSGRFKIEQTFDHPQSAVANGGTYYELTGHSRAWFGLHWWWHVRFRMKSMRISQRVDSGFAWGHKRAEARAREAARSHAHAHGQTRER